MAAGATTGTATLADSVALEVVTVIVRKVDRPAVDNMAVAVPVASVMPDAIGAIAPEEAAKATGTPARTLFAASRAKAEMVAVVEPSLSIEATLLVVVNEATAVVVADEALTTGTLIVAVRPLAVAVTVIVLIVGCTAESVALAAPVVSVVA